MAKDFWSRAHSLFIKSEGTSSEQTPPVSMVEDEPAVEPEPRAFKKGGGPLPPRRAPAPVFDASGGTEVPVDASADIPEGRPFEDIYAATGIPASPYSAERLLTVLAGLAAMPETQIRMCVSAMDAADESWTIEDPVNDAIAKIEALEGEKVRLGDVAASIATQSQHDGEHVDTQLAELSERIKAQIEALQKELHDGIDAANAKKASLQAHVRATQDAAKREALRLDSEIGRLNRVPNTFGVTKTPAGAGRG